MTPYAIEKVPSYESANINPSRHPRGCGACAFGGPDVGSPFDSLLTIPFTKDKSSWRKRGYEGATELVETPVSEEDAFDWTAYHAEHI